MAHEINLTAKTLPTTGMRAIPAEGARCGVVTCLLCGAALFIDPGDGPDEDPVLIHTAYHRLRGEFDG